jgi:hypothetical protein
MRLLRTPSLVRGQWKETRLALLKDSTGALPRRRPVSPDQMVISCYEVPGENISRGQGERGVPISLTWDSAWFGRPAIKQARLGHWRFPTPQPI